MKLLEIQDKNKLNDFVGAQEHAEFLQSWEWGEFQEKAEGKILRLGVEENGEFLAAATLVKKSLPLGMKYFYCPRSPALKEEIRNKKEEIIIFFLDEIKKIAQREKVIFLRFEPNVLLPAASGQLQIKKTIDIQPAQTIILDLAKSEDELLSAMHQKTRYNIRLAEKKGVKIEEGAAKFDDFWRMMDKTAQRDKFTAHNKDYYKKLLQAAPGMFKLFAAAYQEKIIAAGIFAFFGDTAAYLFGASSDEDRNVMAPYLLQWEMIRKAKQENFKYYDFFGISEKKWPGVTRFKRGFAGQEIKYPGTFDLVFNRTRYNIYQALRIIRRLF